jgi:hypothetical protein
VSVLFKFLRKDLTDEKLSRDLRIWLDRAVSVGEHIDWHMFLLLFSQLRSADILGLKEPKHENFGSEFSHRQSLSGWATYELAKNVCNHWGGLVFMYFLAKFVY